MDITWLGHSCFRLRGREATVVIDPYDRSVGYNLGKLSADIVCVSHDHSGHNAVDQVGGNPRLVAGPGEYEIKGVMITGIQMAHDAEQGKQRGRNTVYVFEMDDLVICHLGDLGHVPTTKQVEQLSNVQVLLVPVGGHSTLNAAQAAETISLIDPKLIVPMHYATPATSRELEPLDKFLKEVGAGAVAPQAKLTVTKSSLPDNPQVILLEYPAK